MSRDAEQLVCLPVFVPALSAVLLSAEDEKGEPLTYDEVITIRDEATCVMMRADRARQLDESRGHRDIDPENCWHEWQQLRAQLGRTPPLPAGPTATVSEEIADMQKSFAHAYAVELLFAERPSLDRAAIHASMQEYCGNVKLAEQEHDNSVLLFFHADHTVKYADGEMPAQCVVALPDEKRDSLDLSQSLQQS